MARYDKYEPLSGGHRAPLAADWLLADLNKVFGVGLNASGQVVKGAGNTGVIGALVLTKIVKAGKVVDVMQDGEIVEMNINHAGIVAGTKYYFDAAGALTAVAPTPAGTNGVQAGYTVEATRLIVRVEGVQA
jgi:hypothetical protein